MNTYQNAIYCGSSYGPTFGNGYTIHVSDNSNTNSNSYVRYANAYNIPLGANGNHSILTDGNTNFQTTEVEVYLVQWSTRLKEGIRWNNEPRIKLLSKQEFKI